MTSNQDGKQDVSMVWSNLEGWRGRGWIVTLAQTAALKVLLSVMSSFHQITV